MNIPQAISAIVSVIFITIYFSFVSIKIDTMQNPIFKTCKMVREKIFLPNEKLRSWFNNCAIESFKDEIYYNRNIADKYKKSQTILNALGVSHLRFYNESENHTTWTGELKTNGVVAKYIDGSLVVVDVLHGSPSEKNGIQVGDVLLDGFLQNSNKSIEMNEDLINSFDGVVSIKRKSFVGIKNYSIRLTPTEFKVDEKMKVKIIYLDSRKNSFGYVKIPSFKKYFFKDEYLQEVFEKLKSQKNVVIDLRSNIGGNFVAGLRLLSLFNCQSKNIGYLIRKSGNGINQLSNNLDDEFQIEEIKNSKKVILRTFPNKICLNSQLAILIDAKTSSTAELVSQAFREVNSAKIYGAGSSGQLLVGIWHDIESIWKYKIRLVIPEAEYRSEHNDLKIEGVGVSVDENIYDRIQDYQEQKDSWIEFIKYHFDKIFG